MAACESGDGRLDIDNSDAKAAGDLTSGEQFSTWEKSTMSVKVYFGTMYKTVFIKNACASTPTPEKLLI